MKKLAIVFLVFAVASTGFAKGGGGKGGGGAKGGGRIGGGGNRGLSRALGGGDGTSGGGSQAPKGTSPAKSSGISRPSTAAVSGKSAVGARSSGYNFSGHASGKPYSRYSPSFGFDHKTPAQQALTNRANEIARALADRNSTSIPVNPSNPYYSYINSYHRPATYYPSHSSSHAATQTNHVVNDRMIEQASIIDQCLEVAQSEGLAPELCRDASYDVRVDLIGALDESVLNKYMPFWPASYNLSVATHPFDEDAILAQTAKEVEISKVSDYKYLLSLNMTAAELIVSALDGGFYVRVGKSGMDTERIALRTLMGTAQAKSIDVVINRRFRARITLRRIMPASIQLSEIITQPLGLSLESVKNCARLLTDMKADTELCFQTLVGTPQDPQFNLDKKYIFYALFNGERARVAETPFTANLASKKRVSEIMEGVYTSMYARSAGHLAKYQQLALVDDYNDSDPDVYCAIDVQRLSDRYRQTCHLKQTSIDFLLETEQANVYEEEALDLIGQFNANAAKENAEKLKLLSNRWQVATLRIYVMAQKYYPRLFEELLTLVRSESDLIRIENEFNERKNELGKISDYIHEW